MLPGGNVYRLNDNSSWDLLQYNIEGEKGGRESWPGIGKCQSWVVGHKSSLA